MLFLLILDSYVKIHIYSVAQTLLWNKVFKQLKKLRGLIIITQLCTLQFVAVCRLYCILVKSQYLIENNFRGSWELLPWRQAANGRSGWRTLQSKEEEIRQGGVAGQEAGAYAGTLLRVYAIVSPMLHRDIITQHNFKAIADATAYFNHNLVC